MENTNKLTKKQQFWFDHLARAKELGISLSAYAEKENLNLKAFYNYQTIFRKKGLIEPDKRFTKLTPVKSTQSASPFVSVTRITLRNGICVDLPFDQGNINQLLQTVNKL